MTDQPPVFDHELLVARDPQEIMRFTAFLEWSRVHNDGLCAADVLHDDDGTCCKRESWNQTLLEIGGEGIVTKLSIDDFFLLIGPTRGIALVPCRVGVTTIKADEQVWTKDWELALAENHILLTDAERLEMIRAINYCQLTGGSILRAPSTASVKDGESGADCKPDPIIN